MKPFFALVLVVFAGCTSPADPTDPGGEPGIDPSVGGQSGGVGGGIPEMCVEDTRSAIAADALPEGLEFSANEAAARILGAWTGDCSDHPTEFAVLDGVSNAEFVTFVWSDGGFAGEGLGAPEADRVDCPSQIEFDANATLNSGTFLAETLALHVTVTNDALEFRGSIDVTDMTGTARPDWDLLSGYGATTLGPWASLSEDGSTLSGGIQWSSAPLHESMTGDCGDGGASGDGDDSGSGTVSCGVAYPGVVGPLCPSWILTRP